MTSMTTRRDFLRVLGIGGALTLFPGVFAACADAGNYRQIAGPGSGTDIRIDFADGDVAVLQFAYLVEQLESDFHLQVVASFVSSTLSATERSVLADIGSHDATHRDVLKTLLGVNASVTLTAAYDNVDMNDRVSVLRTATALKELSVGAYNGLAQYLADANNVLLFGKIVSVEARHAAAIRDLIDPRSGNFASLAFDDALGPDAIRSIVQRYVVDRIVLAAPSAMFVQGPNGNGSPP